jgi:hypothetical protein
MKTVVKIRTKQISGDDIMANVRLKGDEVEILMAFSSLVTSLLESGVSLEAISGGVEYGINAFEEKRVEE